MSGNKSSSRQSLLGRIMNPKYIMVYATVIIFLIIYAFGAIAYGSIGFTIISSAAISFFRSPYSLSQAMFSSNTAGS